MLDLRVLECWYESVGCVSIGVLDVRVLVNLDALQCIVVH